MFYVIIYIGDCMKKKKKIEKLEKNVFLPITYIIIGFLLCLIVLYILAGRKNYIKLYYELKDYINAYDSISSEFYDPIKKEEIINNSIDTMIKSVGDEYTTYSNKEEKDDFMDNLNGLYEGIGCTIVQIENKIKVYSVTKNSPAEIAGLKKEDVIIKINNKSVENKKTEDIAKQIKSDKNKIITLTVMRDEKEKVIKIKKGEVEIPTVESKIYKEDNTTIGYIKISIFSSVTYKQFKKELEKMQKKENIDSLIIDVRNNSGGYLSSVTDIASMFLEKNKTIYQLESNNKTTKIKDKTKEYTTYKIAVLINENSASASEILASSIKENYPQGIIIGTNSYGKGTVQKTKILSNESMVKYTIEKWLTPKGKWLNEKGLTPDVEVVNENDKEDKQLQSAIDKLK